jgi:hypothetical protein
MGTAHQRLISVLVAAAAATACAGGTRLFKAATAPAAMQEQVCNLPVSDWRYASPGAVLAIAYEAIGFDGPKAIEMATAELRRLGLSEQGPDPDVVPLDWKNSNLHSVVYDALLADGIEAPTAMVLTNLAHEKVTGQVLIPKLFEGTETFLAYPMYLIYEDAQGKRHQIKDWTPNGCVEKLYKSQCADRIQKCAGRESTWIKVRRSDVSPLTVPSPGSYVYIRWWPEPDWVPNLIEPRNCDLFAELDPIDCNAIEFVCGDHSTGPLGGLDGR